MESRTLAAIAYLIDVAQQRQVVTYGDVGRALGGLNARREVPRLLWKVHAVCEEHDVPSLAALVVNQSELRPGAGYWEDPFAPDDIRDVKWLADLRTVWRFKGWVAFRQLCVADTDQSDPL